MRFTTDQQTLEDLNIFGRHGTDSIYALFNRTYTRGGAALLEDCFRYPLADEHLINLRSGIIRYFARTRTEFPFKTEGFDQAEQYLANEDERTKLVAGDRTLLGKVSGLIAEDTEYKTIHRGVSALVDILQTIRAFVESFGARVRDSADASARGFALRAPSPSKLRPPHPLLALDREWTGDRPPLPAYSLPISAGRN